MKSPEEFDTYYNSTLVPVLESLEPERKKITSTLFTGILFILLCLLAAAPAFVFESPWLLLLVILPLIPLVQKFSEYNKIKNQYVIEFKKTVIERMIKFTDSHLSYLPASFISMNEYSESNLYRERIDSYRGEDLVDGILGKTQLKFSEVQHSERREYIDARGRPRTEWVTIFRGLFFIADFNKNFNGTTFVMPDEGSSFLGIGKFFESLAIGRGEIVKLENPEFEKRFTVYSSDQVEARYILSPAMMEHLNNFYDLLETYPRISFIHSKVYITIPNDKNLFEPNIFSSGVKEDYLREYFHYLDLVTGIVDDLNLNTRIWTKQ